MELGLSGRTAVITGGSKGIGRAIARGLASEGVNLVLIARNAGALEKTAEDIRKESGVTVVAATRGHHQHRAGRCSGEDGEGCVRHRSHRGEQRRAVRCDAWIGRFSGRTPIGSAISTTRSWARCAVTRRSCRSCRATAQAASSTSVARRRRSSGRPHLRMR